MGRRGPPPTPESILNARGSDRVKRRKRELMQKKSPDVEPLSKAPKPPSHLSKDAAAIWRNVVKILVQRRLLSDGDLHTIARYCELTIMLRRALAAGQDEDTPYDLVEESKRSRIVCNVSDKLLAIEKQFGLTPASMRDTVPLKESTPTDKSASDEFFEKNVALRFVK